MNIGAAARQTGLPVKTIRYYEEIGLISPERQANGYRDYGDEHVHKLHFLRRARSLGFGIEDCRQLLSLYEDRGRASADVKVLAQRHIEEIDAKLEELTSLRDTLAKFVCACHGDQRPDCPILNEIAGEA
ncbi:Cu(I)-responsive transcriptional regulator [Breoghania sp.]|uniref:Cu(I)-responsive transcriptional regulator n=1 Tax=Breoghania sp. TaxID=2065378 RepID=UPI00261286F6|nr:Cu(I)-responsive transcriptional regulator [Breoghania sp.]MDJ0931993.1 Cu(I)-responsive transcriptional regulator [Breoghania sp.]